MSATPSQIGTGDRRRRREQVIMFSIGAQKFAIAAAAVQEIKSTDSLAGSAVEIERPSLPKVRHTVARGRRTYYVLSGCAHFGLSATRPAMVLILRDYPVAVLVDGVEGMTDISTVAALPLAFQGAERTWYRGLVTLKDRVVPLIYPGGFLTVEEIHMLDGEDAAQAPTGGVEGVSA